MAKMRFPISMVTDHPWSPRLTILLAGGILSWILTLAQNGIGPWNHSEIGVAGFFVNEWVTGCVTYPLLIVMMTP
jgi:hypothetical protein